MEYLHKIGYCRSCHLRRVMRNNLARFFSDRCCTETETTRKGPPWRVLFFGSDSFSLETLKLIHSHYREEYTQHRKLMESLEIVTNPSQTPVREFAYNNSLPVHDWPIVVDPTKYDVGILASFRYLIPSKIINMFPYGILNVHPSLLPRWRGAAPLVYTVLCNDKVAGVTIMSIKPKHFDTGPILRQKEMELPQRCTTLQLSKMLAHKGSRMVLDVLEKLNHLSDLEKPQNTDGILYAHKLHSDYALINWTEQTISEIDCQYRALSHMYDLRSEYKGMKIKLKGIVDPSSYNVVELIKQIQKYFQKKSDDLPPGTPFYDKKTETVFIKCKDGWIGFENFIIKKPMTSKAFYNGYLSKEENRALYFRSFSSPLQKDIFSDIIHTRKLT